MKISADIRKLVGEYLKETAVTLRAQKEFLKRRGRTVRTTKKRARLTTICNQKETAPAVEPGHNRMEE